MHTEQQYTEAFATIHAESTKAGAGLQTLANWAKAVSDDCDKLETEMKTAGVPRNFCERAGKLGERTQAIKDHLEQYAGFLNALGSKGVDNPVPVKAPHPKAASA